MIPVLLADKNFLSRVGLETLLNDTTEFSMVAAIENDDARELEAAIRLHKPKVLVLDFVSMSITPIQIQALKARFKALQILVITDYQPKQEIKAVLDAGVCSYLLKECDREEIMEALRCTHDGVQFLCGKIAHILTAEPEIKVNKAFLKQVKCDGISVTERELEIIKLIAEGYSNKQIADKLYLSTHTVNTHRKNIMSKLGVNNTAGVVMYAIKHQLLEPNQFLFSN